MTSIGPDDQQGRLEEALVQYMQAEDRGQPLDRAEWLAKYPDLAAELKVFLDGEGAVKTVTKPPPTDNRFAIGSRIGEYELLDVIGIGGMSIVFRAKQVRGNFDVALKMLLTGPHASPGEVQRFVQEVELHARLDHAHIIPIFFVGEYEGLSYFTMKLVEPGSLKDHLDRFRLRREGPKAPRRKRWRPSLLRQRARRIARLMASVAEAVHHAHQYRLLHRDLKPGNILLHGKGHPYVADFGLVMRIDEQRGAAPLAGTPPYMAPEQAQGTVPLSTAADVYGLGAILYELLTGQAPFTGSSTTEVLEKVRTQEPTRPSELQPGVPRGWRPSA
jgi:serine/threonine-protein kinase